MAWTQYQKCLALLLVVTGSINTLSTKWADLIYSKGSDGEIRQFQHPFLQASFMFLGEMTCLIVVKSLMHIYAGRLSIPAHTSALISGNESFNRFILMIPAVLDLIATSTMYVGLNMTYASSYQMFRGSIIIFTALFSVIFLEKKIVVREWAGIGLVIVGLIIVGASDFINKDSMQKYGQNSIITGDLLIILAQIIAAAQMVYEEKYVTKKDSSYMMIHPMLIGTSIIIDSDIPSMVAVGWEGVFGFCTLLPLHIIFYYTPAMPPFSNNPRNTVEDAIDGLIQIGNSPQLITSVLGGVISIAFFNFAGISVTKEISATTRMVLDSIRTLVVWSVSLVCGWQFFHWPQLIGFAVLLVGMCLYNNVLVDKILQKFRRDTMTEPIINHTPADDSNTSED